MWGSSFDMAWLLNVSVCQLVSASPKELTKPAELSDTSNPFSCKIGREFFSLIDRPG
jgi:hypothetical protein